MTRHKLHQVRRLTCAVLLAGSASSAMAGDTIAPFTTDGCSLFPDRSLISNADWCDCCVAHDLAYWRGGTADERASADRRLRDCVAESTGNPRLAELMYAGVRTGGGPYFLTPYRWGYGWPWGRGYTPLSAEESAAADAAAASYMATRPPAICPAPENHRSMAGGAAGTPEAQ